jgi:hypothetical protein
MGQGAQRGVEDSGRVSYDQRGLFDGRYREKILYGLVDGGRRNGGEARQSPAEAAGWGHWEIYTLACTGALVFEGAAAAGRERSLA